MPSSTLDLPIHFVKCLWCLCWTWSKLEKCQGRKQSSKCNRTDRGNDVTNTDYLCLCKLLILGLLFVLFSYDVWTFALSRFINESCIFELICWLMICLILQQNLSDHARLWMTDQVTIFRTDDFLGTDFTIVMIRFNSTVFCWVRKSDLILNEGCHNRFGDNIRLWLLMILQTDY